MSKPDLTEILCLYMETCGLNPSDNDDLYGDIQTIADDTIQQMDDLAEKYQND